MFEVDLIDRQLIEQVNGPAGRRYKTPTGEFYPSVTTIIGAMSDKSGLEQWKKRVGEKEAKAIGFRAAKRGRNMHGMCEDYLMNLPIRKDEDIFGQNRQMFEAIKPILDREIKVVKGVELSLYSHRLQTAGQTDLFAETYDYGDEIIDFKTSTKPKREEWIEGYFIQTAIYAMMLYELYGIQTKTASIIIAVEEDFSAQHFRVNIRPYVDKAYKMIKAYHRGERPFG